MIILFFFFFFFQAEDGIRDGTVTGVSDVCSSDLCCKPTSISSMFVQMEESHYSTYRKDMRTAQAEGYKRTQLDEEPPLKQRSEERRVGKECRSRRSTYE